MEQNTPGDAAWRDSNSICALADDERHWGHILRIGGRWYAFDATHFNNTSNGFRCLGTFASRGAAKQAVEQNRGPQPRPFWEAAGA
jgi:hypothetical protein